MILYEFITLSDPITFKAKDDKIAFCCAMMLGSGEAGCNNTETSESVPAMLFLAEDPEKIIFDFLGNDLSRYVEAHKPDVIEAFKTFAYGSVSSRKSYDLACYYITDPEKLQEFKVKHEEENRSSMTEWVKSAWSYAKALETVNTN
jgi:hypothetical protein